MRVRRGKKEKKKSGKSSIYRHYSSNVSRAGGAYSLNPTTLCRRSLFTCAPPRRYLRACSTPTPSVSRGNSSMLLRLLLPSCLYSIENYLLMIFILNCYRPDAILLLFICLSWTIFVIFDVKTVWIEYIFFCLFKY